MIRPYLRVVPSEDQYSPSEAVEKLKGLQQVTDPPPSGLLSRLNPCSGAAPPTFEFTILTHGETETAPIELYYGVDEEHLETLRGRLEELFPRDYTIERVEVDLAKRLVPPVEYELAEFEAAVDEGRLWADVALSDPSPSDSSSDDGADTTIDDATVSGADGGEPTVGDGGTDIVPYDPAGDGRWTVAPPSARDPEAPLTALDGPTATGEGTILARPAPDHVRPVGLRWEGTGVRKRDRLCSLTPFTETTADERPPPLTTVITALAKAERPVAFQVVFRQAAPAQADAELRIDDLRTFSDTWLERWSPLNTRIEPKGVEDLPEGYRARVQQLREADHKRQFEATVRALTVHVDESATTPAAFERLRSALTEVNGEYYELTPRRVREDGLLSRTKETAAQRAFERFRQRELKTEAGRITGSKRRWPSIEGGPEQLANLVVPPSGAHLPTETYRQLHVREADRHPLPRPTPSILEHFRGGMGIGRAVDETGTAEAKPTQLPADLLPLHVLWLAATGSGKSIAMQNALGSLYAETSGPTVLLDRKGDGMCREYLQAHYEQFGDLDDVYYFELPDVLPAIPFFDLRPALADGRDRATAIQDRIEHFREVMRLVMGREQFDQAFVAVEILGYLMKALYDEEYGRDVFTLRDLYDAMMEMQRERRIPPVSFANRDVERSLTRHFEKDDRSFHRSMDAVGNRLDALMEQTHVGSVLGTVPEWDPATETYTDPVFDFREILDEDVVVLFDMGELRSETTTVISLLLLSNLWDALQKRRQQDREGTEYETLVKVLVEEAAPIASKELVYDQLLPKGRSFGLSLGLSLQFPEQVKASEDGHAAGDRAYKELLNNVHTKIVGNIAVEDDLARALAHEEVPAEEIRHRLNRLPTGEWLVDLPNPEFGETGPRPFSVAPLAIPEGHPQSEAPLRGRQRRRFDDSVAQTMRKTSERFDVDPPTDSTEAASAEEDGAVTDLTAEPADSDDSADRLQEVGASLFDRDGAAANDGDEEHDGDGDEGDGDTDGDDTSSTASRPDPDPDLPPEKTVLKRVLDAMNRDLEWYSLVESMTTLVEGIDDGVVDELLEEGYLEQHRVCYKRYYSVTKEGRQYLRESLGVGEDTGDLGEKTPHKVGVELLRRRVAERPGVEEVRIYYEQSDDVVFDVAGLDADGELVWVGEVEMPSNNERAVIEDYQKLAEVNARAVWAFRNNDTAVEVLETLSEAHLLRRSITGRDTLQFDDMKAAVEEQGAPGMSTIVTFSRLKSELDL